MAEDTEAVEVTAAGAEAGQDTEGAAVAAGAGAGLPEQGAEVSWSPPKNSVWPTNIFSQEPEVTTPLPVAPMTGGKRQLVGSKCTQSLLLYFQPFISALYTNIKVIIFYIIQIFFRYSSPNLIFLRYS